MIAFNYLTFKSESPLVFSELRYLSFYLWEQFGYRHVHI